MVKNMRLTLFIFSILMLLSVSLAHAFVVHYEGFCWPNSTNISVFNATDDLIVFQELNNTMPNFSGCWGPGLYALEVQDSDVDYGTVIRFYLNGMLAGTDNFTYGDLTSVELNLSDIVPPNITLISPANDSTLDAGVVNFNYNVTDHSSIENCSLLINGAVNQTDTSVTKNIQQTFTVSLSEGSYNWSVLCYDDSSNYNLGSSETWLLTIVDHGVLNGSLVSPAADTNVTQYHFLNFSVQVQCLYGNCGFVTAGLDPVEKESKSWLEKFIDWLLDNPITGWAAGALVPSGAGSPWYTVNSSIQACGSMNAGDLCNITWLVNANGSIGTTSEFFAWFHSTSYPNVSNNETPHINLTISNNTAPTISGVVITDPAYTDTVLNCTAVNPDDIDGDPVTFFYEWYFDNILVTGQQDMFLDCENVSGCDKNVNVTCAIIPFDTKVNGTKLNDSVVISNSLPEPNIPDICINVNSSYELNLSQYVTDKDGDSITWTWTNGTYTNITVNLTTTIANFTPNSSFAGIDYANFTADDTDNATTQTVKIMVMPSGGLGVKSFSQSPTFAYRTGAVTIYCQNVLESEFAVETDYRIDGGTWYSALPVYDNSLDTWVSTIQTAVSDFWLGVYDFRCRFPDCAGSGNYTYANGTVRVLNNEPTASLVVNPAAANRSANLSILANCSVSDIEDSAPEMTAEIKYQYPAGGWQDCIETRTGYNWYCTIPGGNNDAYLGVWDVKCNVQDSDSGFDTDNASVSVSNNIPLINLPQNKSIPGVQFAPVMDIDDYVVDVEDADADLTLEIISQSNTSNIICGIENLTRVLFCNTTGMPSSSNITIKVVDTENASASDTIEIFSGTEYVYNVSFNNGSDFEAGDNVSCSSFVRIDFDNATPSLIFSVIYDANGTIYSSGNISAACSGASWAAGKNCTYNVDNIIGYKGQWSCYFIAKDNLGNIDYDYETVNMTNTPPALAPVGYRYGVANRNDNFTLTAYDPNIEDVLVFSTNLTVGTLNTSSGFFNYTPALAQAGSYLVNWSVSDSTASDSETALFDVFEYPCSNISVLYYGSCIVGDGDIDVYVNNTLVAHEDYNPEACTNSSYGIIIYGGPEPECLVHLNDTLDFYLHGNWSGSDTWNYTNDTVVNLNLNTGFPVTTTTTIPSPPKRGGGGRPCRPLWQCSAWGPCLENNTRVRECWDINKCNIIDGVPDVVESCVYAVASCEDNIKNQDESDVDCGGICGATCMDRQTCRTDNDCINNRCENNICVSCYDRIRNQGETGIDCGGPCAPCPVIEVPRPPACEDKVSSWHILLLLITLIVAVYYGDKYYRIYLKEKGRLVPGWLDYIKEEPLANIIGMIILILIALFALVFDNACFEECLAFKSKYILTIAVLVMAGLLGYRLYRMSSRRGLIEFEFDRTVKITLGIMAVLILIMAVLTNFYFTRTCGTCFDGIMNQGELGVDCGGPCAPCIQQPAQIRPSTWIIPMLIVLIIAGGITAYILISEQGPAYKPAIQLPKIEKPFRKSKTEIPPPPKPLIKPPELKARKPITEYRKPILPPSFAEIPGLPKNIEATKEEIERLFAEAYQALEQKDLPKVQKLTTMLAEKYRILPKQLRDKIYHEIMILYDKVEKRLL